MKKKSILSGILLMLAAICFWLGWSLIPDPGSTDSLHILEMVAHARVQVTMSVFLQILSSVLYITSLFLLVSINFSKRRILWGAICMGIGSMGLCADAFFHLLAVSMTQPGIAREAGILHAMEYMQTHGLAFLTPLLLPFLVGSFLLSGGLRKQALLSATPSVLMTLGLILGPMASILMEKWLAYRGSAAALITLGLFAGGHVAIGLELMTVTEKGPFQHLHRGYQVLNLESLHNNSN